jgi:outer membrane immunogenic protein
MWQHRWTTAALAAAGALAFSIPVLAADMPGKAPAYKAALYDWTGFYIGGNIGYSWGKASTAVNVPGFSIGPGFFFDLDVPGAAFSNSTKLNGIIGGGQLGYNVQASNLLVGLELDLQASGQKGSFSRSDPFDVSDADFIIFFTGVTGTSTTQYDARISWFGTVRGRLGFATDGLLLYATGGLAYGRVQLSGSNTVNGVITDCVIGFCGTTPLTAVTALNSSKVNTGWTAGAGIEAAIANSRNWTWKLEYLYMDLGSLNIAAASSLGTLITLNARFTDQIVRFGFNWRI